MKAILIDDERLALDYLEYQLRNMPDVQITGKYMDPHSGKAHILREETDVVFLDIHMHGLNGIELAEQLLECKPGINIVFVTAYDEYAIKAFELNAIDYVLKPLGAERLENTLKRVRERVSAAPESITSAEQPLRLKLFNQVELEMPEHTKILLRWRTSKAQELFLYLVQHQGQQVRKFTLTDLLWPESDADKAASLLYSAIYQIRKTLAPYDRYIKLLNAADGYILNLDNVVLDTKEWENRIQSLPPLSESSMEDYEKLIWPYPGDYLRELDYWWSENERIRLKTLWVKSMTQLAEWHRSREQYTKSIEYYEEICNHHPHAEEGYYTLMQLYARQQIPSAVHRRYRMLDNMLMDEFNERPSPYVTEWYQEWAKNEE